MPLYPCLLYTSLAVSCLTEAVQLRKAGQTLPILILGHVQPAYAAALIQNDITCLLYTSLDLPLCLTVQSFFIAYI